MSAHAAAALHHRISEQLQALSQVGESLTLRLLDLEERIKLIEEHLTDQTDPSQIGSAPDHTGEILALTEERIARLEELLTAQTLGRAGFGVEARPWANPHLSSVAAFAEGSSTEAEEHDHDPFPDDEEQPFMDELSA